MSQQCDVTVKNKIISTIDCIANNDSLCILSVGPGHVARPYSRYFTCINSFYLHHNITRLSSLYGGNGGSDQRPCQGLQ